MYALLLVVKKKYDAESELTAKTLADNVYGNNLNLPAELSLRFELCLCISSLRHHSARAAADPGKTQETEREAEGGTGCHAGRH